jgi:hypothetical protein
MFVRNRTPYEATLIRGHLSETTDVASIVVHSVFRIEADGRLAPVFDREPSSADPPRTSRYALWHEVSVTVSGTVHGPSHAPYVVPIAVSVGQKRVAVAVFGDRRWERSFDDDLLPSDPAPFDAMALSFERAFGGGFDIPPGPDPATGLPHPGGKAAYPKNPSGRGFYRDEAMAEGALLPNIEYADELIEKWDDKPEPAGFSPCPDLVALRLDDDFLLRTTGLRPGAPPAMTVEALAPYAPAVAMRIPHHATGRLIFSEVPPGTPIEVSGVARRAIRFAVVAPPVSVVTASSDKPDAKLGRPLRPELRLVHIDADGGYVIFEHGYTTTYRRDFAPEWLRVLPRAS